MKRKSTGFTLVELVAVITVLAIIAIAVLPKITNPSTFELQTARDDIVAGLFFAQQVAIARGDSSVIRFVSTGSAISVQENGSPLSSGVAYPLSLPTGLTLDSATLVYDKLGRTTASALTLTDGSSNITINISESGYAASL